MCTRNLVRNDPHVPQLFPGTDPSKIHPAVSAAAIASLDHVSGGRAVLGIGAGHSGTKNVGLAKSRANELAEGVTFIKTLLKGAPATFGGATAHLPWIKRVPPVFLAASHPKPPAARRTTSRFGRSRRSTATNRDAARNKVGAMLAFLAGYVIGDKHLETRGVPEPLRAPLLELQFR